MEKQFAVAYGEARPVRRKMTPRQRKLYIKRVRREALRRIVAEILLGIRHLPRNVYKLVAGIMARTIILALLSAGVMLALSIFFEAMIFWMNMGI